MMTPTIGVIINDTYCCKQCALNPNNDQEKITIEFL